MQSSTQVPAALTDYHAPSLPTNQQSPPAITLVLPLTDNNISDNNSKQLLWADDTKASLQQQQISK